MCHTSHQASCQTIDQDIYRPFCHFDPPDYSALPMMNPPDDNFCYNLWDKYSMLPNVRSHSQCVAYIATALAMRAAQLGMPLNVQSVRASALLHDLAKTYCLRHGGSHALLGASWTLQETGNYLIAQGVILHVHWPWQLPNKNGICILPIFIIYADKRVKHDACVTIKERFDDLLVRYGHTEAARAGIRDSCQQALEIEQLLSEQLGWDLHEHNFDCGRLVN